MVEQLAPEGGTQLRKPNTVVVNRPARAVRLVFPRLTPKNLITSSSKLSHVVVNGNT